MNVRLTEEKLADRRFREAEEKIFKAFFEAGTYYVSAVELAKRARVSRATFYRHHQTVAGILSDYEEYILDSYEKNMNKVCESKISTRRIFYQMIVFIFKNKKILSLFIRNENYKVFKVMVYFCNILEISERAFKIYASEVVGLIEEWGENNFHEDGIKQLVEDIVYLAETAERRLGGIKNTN